MHLWCGVVVVHKGVGEKIYWRRDKITHHASLPVHCFAAQDATLSLQQSPRNRRLGPRQHILNSWFQHYRKANDTVFLGLTCGVISGQPQAISARCAPSVCLRPELSASWVSLRWMKVVVRVLSELIRVVCLRAMGVCVWLCVCVRWVYAFSHIYATCCVCPECRWAFIEA